MAEASNLNLKSYKQVAYTKQAMAFASFLSASFVILFICAVYSGPLDTQPPTIPSEKCIGINCVVSYGSDSESVNIYELPSNGYGSSSIPMFEDAEDLTKMFFKNMTGAVQNELENMSYQMSIFMSDIMNLLESQLNILNDRLPVPYAKDCQELQNRGMNASGPYKIAPDDTLGPFIVYCDMQTDGGGWTVLQRRFDGTLDFYRGWDEYVDGFGSADAEHWLGLRQIHRLTKTGNWTLRIDLADFNRETAYAKYHSFNLGDAVSNYPLHFGGYIGTAGNSLSYHRNFPFTTNDRDNDKCRNKCSNHNGTCATKFHGAWWYKSCLRSNLNGKYLGPLEKSHTGMVWQRWRDDQSLKSSQIMIRLNSYD